ncbi:hypothetical protein QVD17_20877 [Tagetes erecta]|uniref:Uncharacterized protein n=1 Tax=Tagetes erecta TaxID=13708 RepID=A0AAD8NYH1_TARER|nr:hypothetical protein QVD17_20877 [Tagetes erecta]
MGSKFVQIPSHNATPARHTNMNAAQKSRLELHFEHCELITEEDGVLERSPSTFLCLKTLKLLYVDLDDIMLSFVFEILRSSPNLQSFEIEAGEQYDVAPLEIFALQKRSYDEIVLMIKVEME